MGKIISLSRRRASVRGALIFLFASILSPEERARLGGSFFGQMRRAAPIYRGSVFCYDPSEFGRKSALAFFP
jgi:hypothetical protein